MRRRGAKWLLASKSFFYALPMCKGTWEGRERELEHYYL